jgi:hypothetical protein
MIGGAFGSGGGGGGVFLNQLNQLISRKISVEGHYLIGHLGIHIIEFSLWHTTLGPTHEP